MLKQIRTEILIKASPEMVWSALTDFSNYKTWNPFIKSIQGQVVVGQKITVILHPPEGSRMTFKPTVLALNRNKEFRWLGHLLFKGLFDGEHKFELIDNNDGATIFIQSETFKGILVPLFSKMLDINTTNGFKLMNEKLKMMVESK